MINETPVRIHLGDLRCYQTTGGARTASVLTPADQLPGMHTFIDIALAPGADIAHKVHAGPVLVLPIVGKVNLMSDGQTTTIDSNQLWVMCPEHPQTLLFKNPYAKESVAFLVMELVALPGEGNQLHEIDLVGHPNTLINLASHGYSIQLGMYRGRMESAVKTQTEQHHFVFVIAGAFEVQHRLLHARDGLSLTTNEIEFEALSNGAIILIISRDTNRDTPGRR